MLARGWQVIRNTLIVIGVALGFFAVMEVIRAYETLRGLHPLAGALFLLVVLAGLIGLIVFYMVSVERHPPVLLPPPRPEDPAKAPRACRMYAVYLIRVMQRLAGSPALTHEQQTRLMEQAGVLNVRLARPPDTGALMTAVDEAERVALQPAMTTLNALAEREVRTCVRDVMIAVSFSPWRSIDLLVVLYRNLGMVTRIIHVYDSRPRAREQLAILRDILAVVATVNFLNYGSKLFQNLTASVPVLGRFTDDLAQGIGAGLLTSVAGHAALDRCQAFRGWDHAAAQTGIGARLRGFIVDIKGIVTRDLVPQFLRPNEGPASERTTAGAPDRVREGIDRAIDETTDLMDSFIGRPVAAAGRGVIRSGAFMGHVVAWGVVMFGRTLNAAAQSTGNGVRTLLSRSGRAPGPRVPPSAPAEEPSDDNDDDPHAVG